VGAVLILRDISDRKQAEAQLMLSDRMASVGALAAGVAHEINTPLASVSANLELAMRALGESLGPEHSSVELLRDVRTGAERVQHIVRDLKVFSRSEEDTRGPVDVERLIESTLRLAGNELRHRAQLRKRYSPVPLVDANESRLGQVLLNLIINAAQAIPEGRFEENEVRVETDVDSAGRVVVTIADTGEGIPLEARARIFTPFFTTKPVGVGTGLGLSICHRIVTSFGGSISFETETGKGTTFRVVLPGTQQVAAPIKEQSSKRSPAARRGHVLAVDDDEGIGRTVVRILETEHEVTWASSGRRALELIGAGAVFDVILCDLMMPQMTGMDVYEQLQLHHPSQIDVMVFLTGGAFTARARAFLDTIPNARLEKPFDLEKLRALVNDFVR
jgi:two-component system cell cycle sensor histidine kinase/response regulator CckA